MLAINTAFMTANLAIKKGDRIVVEDIDAKSKHSENILRKIDEMLQVVQEDILNVETVAVVTGPGSFTGLRIGVAIAKALECVNPNLKFISLSSLEFMAYIIAKNKMTEQEFYCVINALSDLYFVCKFDKNGIKLEDERMIDKDEFEKIKQNSFAIRGDLTGKVEKEIELTSEDLLDFAVKKESDNEYVSIEKLNPVYLRLSQAEDNLLKKSKKD